MIDLDNNSDRSVRNNPTTSRGRRRRQIILLIVLAAILALLLVRIPLQTGVSDFRAYWSASLLLGRGENYVDEANVLRIEAEHTGWKAEYALKTWNPPWVLVWLLPYAALPFRTAANAWLATNVLLLSASIALAWRYVGNGQSQRWAWLPLLAAILFPSTIVEFIFGQVALVALFGLAAFLVLYRRGNDFAAGALLTLVTIKPHLVYLALVPIGLELLFERRWRVIGGGLVHLGLATGIAFALRPTFISDFLASTGGADLLNWEGASLSTYLAIALNQRWIHLIGPAFIPVMAALWWWGRRKFPLLFWVTVGLFLSIMTMPYGWSYDYVILLIPLTAIWFGWQRALRQRQWVATGSILAMLLTIYGAYFYQRYQAPTELYYFWVPVALAVVYGANVYISRDQRAVSFET